MTLSPPSTLKTCLAVGALGLALCAPLHAATYTWNSSSATTYNTAGSWLVGGSAPATAPGSLDDITTPTLFGAALLSSGTSTVNSLTYSSATSWEIRGNATPATYVVTNALNKSGAGTLNFGTSGGALTLDFGAVTLSGTAGTLALGATSNRVAGLTMDSLTVSVGVVSLALADGTTANLGDATLNDVVNIRNVTATGTSTVVFNSLTGGTNGRVQNNTNGTITAGNGVMRINSTNVSPTTFAGIVRNNGGATTTSTVSVVKDGTGTQIFSGANSYSGGTVIAEGTLLATNSTGSGVGSGNVSIEDGGRLGGSGFVVLGSNTVTVADGGVLLGGNGTTAAGTLSVNAHVSLLDNSEIVLTLGAGGTHSTLARTGGTWAFDSNQTIFIVDAGAAAGTYTNIITGLASNPGVSNWVVDSGSWTGTFSYLGGNVSLNLVAVPEPTTTGLFTVGLIACVWRMRYRKGNLV